MDFLQIKHPIIQAPMAGVTTPEFVAACAEAGVLGSIGAGYLSAIDTRKFIREVKALTEKPFAVNLFIPELMSLMKYNWKMPLMHSNQFEMNSASLRKSQNIQPQNSMNKSKY